MYLWKCWRDTRGFFVVLVIIAALVMPAAAAVTGLLHYFGANVLQSTFALIGICTAIALGARTASEAFPSDTLHFLFTKPRSRAYFVRMSWAVGCVEMLAIVTTNFAVGYFTLLQHNVDPFRSAIGGPGISFRQIAGNLVAFVLDYSLVYALTIASRRAEGGLAAGAAVVFGFPAVATLARLRWGFDMHKLRIPSAALDLLLLALALIFVLSAQVLVERREV